jgi:ribosomal protein S3
MLNFLKKLLGLRHEINSKDFRNALKQYPYNERVNDGYLFNITSVRAFETRGNVLVVIRTHRPGHLVGAKGVQIAGIKALMERYSGKKVEIYLIEEDMFDRDSK